MTESECTYILDAINYMFPDVKVTAEDIESSWAGLRPLIYEEGKDPSEISRKDEIWISDSGLITIAGGKLTGYRKMAEWVVDTVVKKLALSHQTVFRKCETRTIPISGGDVGGSERFPEFIQSQVKIGMTLGLTKTEAVHLASRYGSNVLELYKIVEQRGEEANRFNLPIVLFSKLVYAIENEMIVTPVDFLLRRTWRFIV